MPILTHNIWCKEGDGSCELSFYECYSLQSPQFTVLYITNDQDPPFILRFRPVRSEGFSITTPPLIKRFRNLYIPAADKDHRRKFKAAILTLKLLTLFSLTSIVYSWSLVTEI